jgi:hypothetical protein
LPSLNKPQLGTSQALVLPGVQALGLGLLLLDLAYRGVLKAPATTC